MRCGHPWRISRARDIDLPCGTCKRILPFTSFYSHKNPNGNSYRNSHCKECVRVKTRAYYQKRGKRFAHYRMRAKYGISGEQFEAMLAAQGGVCKICKSPRGSTKKDFHVDHSHKTGKIRAVLCSRCNTALGLLKDDISVLETAISYLKEFES